MLLLVLLAGVAATEPPEPIACLLSSDAYSNRMTEIETLFSANDEVLELEDGYAFRFPGESEWAHKLLGFIDAERSCCPFFRFELVFEPDQGPIWLRLRGSQEIKAFLADITGRLPAGSPSR